MRIRILRKSGPDAQPYWQEFYYENRNNDQTIAGMLDELNYKDDLVDINGEHAPRIQWECSCLQGLCGACAMVINGIPALACETFLRDLRGDTIVIEPLRKFPSVFAIISETSSISRP